MKSYHLLLSLMLSAFFSPAVGEEPLAIDPIDRDGVEVAMLRATRFMMDSVSYQGAFVWDYLPDRSRSWGELEATQRGLVWIQPPGTPSMGHILLDAYHATHDEYYYEQARRIGGVLMKVQHPEGGWNYVESLDGEDSLRVYYATLGRQAWRIEEFQYYYGNSTFDDEATSIAAQFLLRLYLEKQDAEVGQALERVIQMVLRSQYAHGGWPQRYPLRYDHPYGGRADYSSFVTLNDDVMANNVEFLLQCYLSLGREELRDPLVRAMYLMAELQHPEPYAGWSDQYEPETLRAAHARSYEPRSVNTGTTLRMMRYMCQYYQWTGDERFLQGIPAALRFLQSQRLSAEDEQNFWRPRRDSVSILVPRFVDPDDGRPLYVHRVGSNVATGHYYIDQDIRRTIVHYSSAIYVHVDELQAEYQAILNQSRDSLLQHSPLLHPESHRSLPLFFYNASNSRKHPFYPTTVSGILRIQTPSGYWPTPIAKISEPYTPMPEGLEPSEETTYATTNQGDQYDTSPYHPKDYMLGITVRGFIQLMSNLIACLQEEQADNINQ